MMKKILSLFVALIFALSAFTAVYATDFSDVTSSYSWAQEAIDALAKNKIVEGYPDGTFKPGKDITKEEAIVLFARCLGASDEDNADVVTAAYENAESKLAKYDSYALKQAAYLMYKMVLNESDLATYLSAANKSQPLKRYEAATLIAKSLGGEVWLKSNPDVEADFADSDEIPEEAQGYVYYASELGIIQGMENDKFVPDGNVTRAQVSVMIHRILNMMQYSYSKWSVAAIDTATGVVTLKNEDEIEKYTIGNSVPVMIDGEKSAFGNLRAGMEAVLTFVHDMDTGADRLYSLDAVSVLSDETIEGIYRGKTTDNSGTTVTIGKIDDATDTAKYTLADDFTVLFEGEPSTLADFKNGDYVTLAISRGKIVVIDGAPKTTKVEKATIESIPATATDMIKIRTNDGYITEYALAKAASVRRNGSNAEFRDLAVGDSVTLTLEYGRIKTVDATGLSKNVEGIIDSIYHSGTESRVGVKIGNKVTEYVVSRDAKIVVSGQDATLYDLRVGYTVTVKTSSLTLTEITVKAAIVSTQKSVHGVISAVNPDWGMIQVNTTAATGEALITQVFLKKGATIMNSSTGKTLSINNLAVGMTVMAAGTETGGIFETSSVMVVPE